MATKIRIAPKGMGLNDFVADEEGFFTAEGLDIEFDWKTFRGTQSSWKHLDYFQRPQDQPYAENKQDDLIQGACAWGSVCNAAAGMGRFVHDCYGISPWAIFVRADSKIRKPEDLADVPVAVGMRAGSHFNVPYRLEAHLPLDKIKTVNVGGFGARLTALLYGRGRGRQPAAAADRDGGAARPAPDHRQHVPHDLVGARQHAGRDRAGLSARARPRREGARRRPGEIPAAVGNGDAGRVRRPQLGFQPSSAGASGSS